MTYTCIRLLEAEPFHPDPVRRLYLDLLAHWERVGGAGQVPWQYIMIMELSLTAALSPTAVLFALPTLRVYSVIWWFLLHPGATNTSAPVKFYANVLDLGILEAEINARRADLRQTWAEQNREGRRGRTRTPER